jgi:hypothetical protein
MIICDLLESGYVGGTPGQELTMLMITQGD